ncbi:MAG: CRISPR-associated protein Csx19 [Gemmataceae bacterium]|nr:CRISPR-associated protein Csx19 [Gemmataceae bacterium]MDW8265801.1 CRISPR-associated protein Csx19 [Gemmataceae bacterium]
MNPSLFVYSRERLPLTEALDAFARLTPGMQATAMLYSPRRCAVALAADGAALGPTGQRLDLNGVFEARVFSETAELRWLNDPGPEQCHRAVILAENDCSVHLPGWMAEQRSDVIDTLPQRYFLWGEGTGQTSASGWSELSTARIGGFLVPVANVGRNGRVTLLTVEYVVEAEHGNAIVFDERLLKLEVHRA